jgi:hypothetical protein
MVPSGKGWIASAKERLLASWKGGMGWSNYETQAYRHDDNTPERHSGRSDDERMRSRSNTRRTLGFDVRVDGPARIVPDRGFDA